MTTVRLALDHRVRRVVRDRRQPYPIMTKVSECLAAVFPALTLRYRPRTIARPAFGQTALQAVGVKVVDGWK